MALPPKLGELLVRLGKITQDQLDAALAEQARTKEPLGQILLRRGFIDERTLAQVLADQQRAELVSLKEIEPEEEALRLLDPRFAAEHRVFPYKLEGNRLYVAMARPSDLRLLDELRFRTGKEIVPKLAPDSEIAEAIREAYAEVPEEAEPAPAEVVEHDLTAAGSPVVELADAILREAIAARASDLHLEPEEKRLLVRMRVDGVMQVLRTLPKEMEAPLAARYKVLAGLDIAERRRPQDGHFSYLYQGRRVEVRIASVGALWGEAVVLRLIYPSGALLGLDELGMLPEERAKFERLLKHPYGILFVTGPTGSGKTTTLYAALRHIYTPEKNFVTIEDPVEFPLEGVNQIPVQPRIGLTFAKVLRAVLRLDPDVILVGEIRDAETLETALRAALTGHLVLATLHTNDALSTVSRLVEMGAERHLVASTLVGAVAQRLVRRVCPQCGRWQPLSGEEEAFLGGAGLDREKRGEGCSFCRGSGYKGRVGLYEVFAPDREALKLIALGEDELKLREHARAKGHRGLKEVGLELVRRGETTVSELMRVLGALED